MPNPLYLMPSVAEPLTEKEVAKILKKREKALEEDRHSGLGLGSLKSWWGSLGSSSDVSPESSRSRSRRKKAYDPTFSGAANRRTYEEALAASQPRFPTWQGLNSKIREAVKKLTGRGTPSKFYSADIDGDGEGGSDFDAGHESEGKWVEEEIWCVRFSDGTETQFACTDEHLGEEGPDHSGSERIIVIERPAAELQPRNASGDNVGCLDVAQHPAA